MMPLDAFISLIFIFAASSPISIAATHAAADTYLMLRLLPLTMLICLRCHDADAFR